MHQYKSIIIIIASKQTQQSKQLFATKLQIVTYPPKASVNRVTHFIMTSSLPLITWQQNNSKSHTYTHLKQILTINTTLFLFFPKKRKIFSSIKNFFFLLFFLTNLKILMNVLNQTIQHLMVQLVIFFHQKKMKKKYL